MNHHGHIKNCGVAVDVKGSRQFLKPGFRQNGFFDLGEGELIFQIIVEKRALRNFLIEL